MEKLAADSGGKWRENWRIISAGRLRSVENSSALGRGRGEASNPIQVNTFVMKSIVPKVERESWDITELFMVTMMKMV